MKNKLFIESLEKLKSLKLPKGEFVIYGSGPLVVRGLKKFNDLDVLVTKKLFQKLSKIYQVKQRNNSSFIEIGKIEIFKKWLPWSKEEESLKVIKKAEVINGLPYARLEDILEWKEVMKRQKDLTDIKVIKNYLLKNSRQK